MADIPLLTWRTAVTAPVADNDTSTPQTEHFICSSDASLIDLDAVDATMASDIMWWCKPLTRPKLQAMVNNSVCLGVYTTDGPEGLPQKMVGFGRLITDRITFAYLTDVYVLPTHQRRGLGSWMMRCLRELCEGSGPDREGSIPFSEGWQDLRSLWLVASTESAARMYMGALGAEEAARYRPSPGVVGSGMVLVEMPGPANGIRYHAQRNATLKAEQEAAAAAATGEKTE